MKVFFFIVITFIASCAQQTIVIKENKTEEQSNEKAESAPQSEAVAEKTVEEEISNDFHGLCKIKIQVNGDTKSGNCEMALTEDDQFFFEILDPIGRSLVKVYLNRNILTVINHYDETFLEADNTSDQRTKIFGMDLNLTDLRVLLMADEAIVGSLSKPEYTVIKSKGKPVILTKINNSQKINIFIKSWLAYQERDYPKKVIINETVNDARLLLVTQEVKRGKIKNLKKLESPEGYKQI